MDADACEIARLPEELLSAALARTSTRDACRAAAVSPAFRAAADSDAVWACFLPRALPPLADGELADALPRKKDLFLRLSDRPVLLPDRRVSMWLDRESGAKCYMLSARDLTIIWGDTPQYWTWIPLADSRFSEGAQLRDVCWFEIRGKIQSKMLSEDTTYAAYIVFKLEERSIGLDYPAQEASVSVGGTSLTRKVCFHGYDDDGEAGGVPENYRPIMFPPQQRVRRRNGRPVPHGENVGQPQKRADGWMELELGEFFNEGGEDGEVSFSLMEIKGGHWKSGLIVQGIEVRRKASG
ncbi:F-box protein PP2-B10-like [Lolium rigidum]|uniref:F-box protein PP2-B10-like n=1 Tax=Lolium rigidum TaxID=89674 RepID=UPI001F5DAC8D|nr:F-box protein PP2-B10-like [Lolium rigidum]